MKGIGRHDLEISVIPTLQIQPQGSSEKTERTCWFKHLRQQAPGQAGLSASYQLISPPRQRTQCSQNLCVLLPSANLFLIFAYLSWQSKGYLCHMRDLHVTVSKTLFWNIRSESYKITPSGTHQGQETGSLKRHLFCMQTPQFLFILPWFLGWHSCVDSCFRTLRCSKLGSSVLQVAVNFPLLVAAVGIFLINLVFANFSLNWINLSFQPPHMDDKELITEAVCLGKKHSCVSSSNLQHWTLLWPSM